MSLTWIKNTAIRLIFGAYKYLLSPYLGDCCRFHPSCSEYCRTCLEEHKLHRALYLSVRRILRCNKFSAGGFDPVPKKD